MRGMVSFVAILRHNNIGEVLLKYENLIDHLEDAAHRLRCSTQQLILNAYEFAFGKDCNVRNEAHLAVKRYKKRGTLCKRAQHALELLVHRYLGWRRTHA